MSINIRHTLLILQLIVVMKFKGAFVSEKSVQSAEIPGTAVLDIKTLCNVLSYLTSLPYVPNYAGDMPLDNLETRGYFS
jgi:hypothetical protein